MKHKLYVISFFALLVAISLIVSTLALFETNASGTTDLDVGNFVVKLNNVNIINGDVKTFEINSFTYEDNDHIANGYIAPGRNGYFDVILDATESDVAVKYDITFDLTNSYDENITYSVTSLSGTDTTKNDDNSYSGIIRLEDINANKQIKLRISVSWTSLTQYDNSDTELGLKENNKITIPVTIHAYQYLGE